MSEAAGSKMEGLESKPDSGQFDGSRVMNVGLLEVQPRQQRQSGRGIADLYDASDYRNIVVGTYRVGSYHAVLTCSTQRDRVLLRFSFAACSVLLARICNENLWPQATMVIMSCPLGVCMYVLYVL